MKAHVKVASKECDVSQPERDGFGNTEEGAARKGNAFVMLCMFRLIRSRTEAPCTEAMTVQVVREPL
jgi:hypothetical protein